MVAHPVDPLAPGQPTAAVSAAEDDVEALLLQVLSEEPPGQEPPPPSGGEVIHFAAGTPRAGSVIEGFEPGVDKLSFDGFGPGATLAHEVGGAPDEYRVTAANGDFDTFVVKGVQDLSAADYAWDAQTAPPPPGDDPGEVPGDGPGEEPGDGGGDNGGEVIHLQAFTTPGGFVVEGFDKGTDRMSFDGYGPGAIVAHEVGGAPDEYRVTAANGNFDTFHLPGVTDFGPDDYVFDHDSDDTGEGP